MAKSDEIATGNWPWAWIIALALAVIVQAISATWLPDLARAIKARGGPFDEIAPIASPPEVRPAGPYGSVSHAPDGRTYAVSGRSLIALTASGQDSWTFTGRPTELLGRPVVAPDGAVYVPSNEELRAFTAAGELEWSSPASDRAGTWGDGRILTIALGPDHTLYVGGWRLWAYARDGSIKWRSDEVDWVPSLLAIENAVYAGGHEVVALRAADGHALWNFPAIGNGAIAARDADGTLYLRGRQLIALSADGQERWRRDFEAPVAGAVVHHNRVFVAAGAMYCLGRDGAELWRFRPKDYLTSGPVVAKNVVAAGRTNVVAVDTSGRLQWRVPTPHSGGAGQAPDLFVDPEGSIVVAQGLGSGHRSFRLRER